MNFLAHTFLSCRDEKMLIGNFLGDFVKNKDIPHYEEGIQQGIFLHRKIDTYTDNHPLVKQGARRLYAAHGKYGSVIIDVFYDHFLAKNWSKYHHNTLDDFTKQVYPVFLNYLPILPPKLQNRLRSMVDDNWLALYAERSGIAKALNRMRSRLSRPSLFEGVMGSFDRDYELLDAEFQVFFPELMVYVERECWC